MNTVPDNPVFEFAGFRLDAAQRRLYGPDGQPIPLAARAFDTLLYLLEHPGALLDKDHLMQAVWPNVVVAENNLNQAISALRHAIGEGHIVTIAGRGYQFVTPVTRLTTPASPEAVLDSGFGAPVQSAGETPLPVTQPEQPATHPRPNKSTAALYGLVVVLVVLAAVYLYFSRHEILVEPITNLEQAVTFSAPVTQDKSVTVVGAPLQSVAVLAFADMSPDQDQEYFADGVSEEVFNQLSQIRDLFVVGRTSSFSFKGKNEDLRVIGEKLGVSHVLEGSVRKEGNLVR
ncbi:MAG TPA: winged helix-turn-helix domain-containing protein, partial [Candidatus Glassbacteria bacterium]|nr:winged helix-turn-helix domain-containing protein [Candidatus Glassbacteria bacterium]